MLAHHVCGIFYATQFVCSSFWWVFVYKVRAKLLYDTPEMNPPNFVKPKWLPLHIVVTLHKYKKFFFIGKLLVCFITAIFGDYIFIRIIACAIIVCYHLIETSCSQRHGEYPLLYNSVAMVLPSNFAAACSFGIVIHFILSSGVAKIVIGGLQGWVHSSTMRLYLTVHGNSSSMPPLSQKLNKTFRDSDFLCTAVSIFTLALECVFVPLSLFINVEHRWIITVLMVIMHIGIATVMSFVVGILFFTTLSAYVVGFSYCSCQIFSVEWWVAFTIGILPNLFVVITGRLLPEIWPSSAISLFMWNGSQARLLADTTMIGDTRIVMTTKNITDTNELVGKQVISSITPLSDELKNQDFIVHDIHFRIIFFTQATHQDFAKFVTNTDKIQMKNFLQRIEQFFNEDRTIYESSTGKSFKNAYFVKVEPTESKKTWYSSKILEVLETADSAKTCPVESTQSKAMRR